MPKLETVHSNHLSPLRLLRKVRDVLQADEAPQERLDKLAAVVANGYHSEVCSIYFVRPGDILELYASKGLKKESVHATRLRFGEGLVGDIAHSATPLNLPDAKAHPNFAYRPETGEEIYSSFVGVPILYNHRVIGVLVVQSADAKIYSDDQVEVLQTVAMVLSELAINRNIVDLQEVTGETGSPGGAQVYSGVKLAPGMAKAPAVLHRPRVIITNLLSDNPALEEKRLKKAILELQHSVDVMINTPGAVQHEAHLEILETYRMFSHDQGWLNRITDAIRTGLSAEAAVKKVQEQMHARLSASSSSYIRERMEDLEDLSSRLLYHLSGKSPTASRMELPDGYVLVARSLGPADLLEYNNTPLCGVVLEEGTATSHIAIIAKMMNVPVVARIPKAIDHVQEGDLIVVDGDHGEVYIRPTPDIEQAINEHLEQKRARDAEYESKRDLPPVTKDGTRISLNLNIGMVLGDHQLDAPDVDGVGLYRSELPYLASNDLPSVDDQKKIYGAIFRHAHGKRITFRSFDIGGDKQVPYVQIEDEENPAMGWRATRIGLDRPAILRRQFRAMIRAAAGHELCVMYPFIAEVSEYDATHALLLREMERAKVEGKAMPTSLRTGSMLEIPSLLFQLPALLERVDFISIGSNDLFQFLFACDRGSDRLAGRYDPLSPVVLRIMRDIARQCDAAGKDLGFCGDMATRPIEAMALIGCGVRNLSVPPSSVGPIKAMLRSLDRAALANYLDYLLTLDEHSLRNALEQFARDHGVEV